MFSGVQDPDIDPAFGVLRDYLFKPELPLRVASTFGLGLAYANCKRGTAIHPDDSVVQELKKVDISIIVFKWWFTINQF